MLTLVIAAVASVIAALVVSKLWRAGTLWATAMTPVIIALVKESLERPARRVREATIVPRHRAPGEELIVEDVEPGPFPSARPQPAGYKTYGMRRKHWRLAIITGLAAFALGAAILTVPELVAGRSLTHSGQGTTLFKGKSSSAKKKSQSTETQTVTTTVPSQTQTTTTPTQTTTTPTTTTTTPAQTTTTPPQGTTTTPPPGQTTPTVPAP